MSKIYCIKNTKTGFCNRPIYVNSEEEALNVIQNILIADTDKALFGLKKDLVLLYLGLYDDVKGVIIPHLDKDGFSSNVEVCTLEAIFDSIPKELVKPAVTRDEISALVDKVRLLTTELAELRSDVSLHTHPTKKGVAYFG